MTSQQQTDRGRWWSMLHLITLFFWVTAMLWLSLTPAPPAPPDLLAWDKMQHALAYGILTLLSAPLWRRLNRGPLFTWGAAVLVTVLFGGGLELAQGCMTTTRQAEWADLVADLTGAIFAAGGGVLVIDRGAVFRRKRLNSRSKGS